MSFKDVFSLTGKKRWCCFLVLAPLPWLQLEKKYLERKSISSSQSLSPSHFHSPYRVVGSRTDLREWEAQWHKTMQLIHTQTKSTHLFTSHSNFNKKWYHWLDLHFISKANVALNHFVWVKKGFTLKRTGLKSNLEPL